MHLQGREEGRPRDPPQAPDDEFWGDRVCTVVDSYGFEWSLDEHVTGVCPQDMAAAAQAANRST